MQQQHPRAELYTDEHGYQLIGYGREAALYRKPAAKVVHKFWRQDWVLAHYPIFRSGKRYFTRAASRAAERFTRADSENRHDLIEKERSDVPHHGIPIDDFRRITLILSVASQDLIRQARTLGIPTPKVARAIPHPTKPLYVLEISDLSKKGHSILTGNELYNENKRQRIENYRELLDAIKEDEKKLAERGYVQDLKNHPANSSWIIRINNRTRIAERFFCDVTNMTMLAEKQK